MALEDLTGTKYLDDLVATNPAAGDNVSEGDDHIRGIKNVLKLTFPNVDAACNATPTEFNYVDGVTSAIQTQFDAITANDWVTAARMADNSVDSDMYVDGSIDLAHMSVNSIDSDQYVDGSIDTAHFAAGAVDAAAMGANSVDSSELVDGSVDLSHMSVNSIDSDQYVDGSIDTAHIANDQITAALMADNSIDSDMYVDGSIDNAHLADDAVDSDEIAAGAIDLAHMSVNSIDSDQYVDGSIDAAHLSSSLGDLGAKGITDIGHNAGDKITFTDNTDMRFTVNAGEEMRLEADGDLHVDGDVIAYSTTISDATLKYNINPVEFALDKIKQLKGVTFNYLKGNRESAGLLAQDVEKVMPSAVSERKLPLHTGDDKAYKTLHYDSMTAILVEAIKELTAKVEKLENK